MAKILIKRGTRAQLDAAKGAGTLNAGEPYLVTDERALAVGTAAGDYANVGDAGIPQISHSESNYTLQRSDRNCEAQFDSLSAQTVTLDTSVMVAGDVGLFRDAYGKVTFQAAAGTNVYLPGSLGPDSQFALVGIGALATWRVDANGAFLINGELAA